MTLISEASDTNIRYMLIWTDLSGNIFQEVFEDETGAIAVANIKSDAREGSDRCIIVSGIFNGIKNVYNPYGNT